MKRYVGLDIGGTKFLVACADQDGEILRRVREPAPRGLDEGLEALHEMIAAVTDDSPIDGMGAAAGGPLDWQNGVVSPLHQPEWNRVPLKDIMERRWQCPFAVDVDTNVAALGEYYSGSSQPSRLLYLTVSTGMGGGLLVDGEIYRGADGGHPEPAHQSINYRSTRCAHPAEIACECGAPDCLEALVSGNGIRRVYGKAPENLEEEEWEEVAYNLGQGLRNLATVYLPDTIVLGGGVAIGRGEKLVSSSQQVMRDRLQLVAPPDVRLSELGSDTALMGSLVLAMQRTG